MSKTELRVEAVKRQIIEDSALAGIKAIPTVIHCNMSEAIAFIRVNNVRNHRLVNQIRKQTRII